LFLLLKSSESGSDSLEIQVFSFLFLFPSGEEYVYLVNVFYEWIGIMRRINKSFGSSFKYENRRRWRWNVDDDTSPDNCISLVLLFWIAILVFLDWMIG
jgi:hypothetical protein